MRRPHFFVLFILLSVFHPALPCSASYSTRSHTSGSSLFRHFSRRAFQRQRRHLKFSVTCGLLFVCPAAQSSGFRAFSILQYHTVLENGDFPVSFLFRAGLFSSCHGKYQVKQSFRRIRNAFSLRDSPCVKIHPRRLFLEQA